MMNKNTDIYKHFYQIFQSFRVNQKNSADQFASRFIFKKYSLIYLDRKTLIFDLDETLIHCTKTSAPPYDIMLSIKQPEKLSTTDVGFNIRPYAK